MIVLQFFLRDFKVFIRKNKIEMIEKTDASYSFNYLNLSSNLWVFTYLSDILDVN